jgi:hypothetical protein
VQRRDTLSPPPHSPSPQPSPAGRGRTRDALMKHRAQQLAARTDFPPPPRGRVRVRVKPPHAIATPFARNAPLQTSCPPRTIAITTSFPRNTLLHVFSPQHSPSPQPSPAGRGTTHDALMKHPAQQLAAETDFPPPPRGRVRVRVKPPHTIAPPFARTAPPHTFSPQRAFARPFHATHSPSPRPSPAGRGRTHDALMKPAAVPADSIRHDASASRNLIPFARHATPL